MKQSRADKKYEKESVKIKKICNCYLDMRKKVLKNTQIKVEDIFGNIISKNSISPEQTTKLKNFWAKIMCSV